MEKGHPDPTDWLNGFNCVAEDDKFLEIREVDVANLLEEVR